MGKDLVLGLSAMFLVLVSAVVWSALHLVSRNVGLYLTWMSNSRETRVKMALWLGLFIITSGMMWQRGNAFAAILANHWVSEFGRWSTIGVVGYMTFGLAFALWYACDRNYGSERGDVIWCHIMWAGLGTGFVTSLLSWIY